MCWPEDRPATHAAAGAAARGVRGIGGLFHTLGSGSTRGFDFLFWGALLPFVLRVVAGACVGRWTGQPRMPPQERLHEEVFVWFFLALAGVGHKIVNPPADDNIIHRRRF